MKEQQCSLCIAEKLKQVQITMAMPAFSTFITNFISKLHLAEATVFLVGRRPLKAQINSADGPSSSLWKRNSVLDGDTQQTRGVWDDAKCVSALLLFCGQGTLVVLDGAARQPSKAQHFPGYFHRMSHNCRQKKKVSVHLASDIVSSVI